MGLFGKKSKDEPAAPEPAPKAVAPAPIPAPAPVAAQTPPAATPAQTPPAAVASQPAASAAAKPAASPEDMEKGVAQSQQSLFIAGQITTVMMNSPQFQSMPLGALKGLLVPAVSTGQFLIATAQSNETGHFAPIAVAIWANVSDEVDSRLSQNLDQPFEMSQQDWTSGQHAWLVAAAGDNRAIDPLIAQLQSSALAGRVLKTRATDSNGVTSVKVFDARVAA